MRSLAALVLLPLAVSPAVPPPEAEELTWAPEDGSVLGTTLFERAGWELESMEQSAGGRPVPVEPPDLRAQVVRRLVVVDTIEGDEDGPGRIRRSLETVAGELALEISAGGGGETHDVVLESPLESEEVTWVRDDEGGWELDEADAAREELAGLRADLSQACLLPGGPVEEGDSWAFEGDLLPLLGQGGDPLLEPLELSPSTALMEQVDVVAAALLVLAAAEEAYGEVSATWSATREEDGRRLAVIDLEVDGSCTSEAGEDVLRMLEAAGGETDRDELELSLATEFSGEGRLVWDLDGRRFRALELDLDLDARAEMTWVQDLGGARGPVEIGFALSGSSRIEGECEAE